MAVYQTRERIAIAALLCLGFGLRLANSGNVAFRTPDERVYANRALAWIESGPAAVRSTIVDYLRDPAVRNYPAPTRVGVVRLIAAWMRVTGQNGEAAGVGISTASSILSLLIVTLIGVRLFPPWATFFAILFYAVSPAELAIARRAWPDATVELVAIALVAITCEITLDSRRRVWYVLLAVVGSAGIAIKESMPLQYGLCGLWIVFVLVIERREWKNLFTLAAAAIAGLAVVLAWLTNSVGSLSDLLSIMSAVPASNAVNSYSLEYASGPAWLMLEAFWIVSPVAAVLSVAGLYRTFADLRKPSPQRKLIAFIAAFAVVDLAIGLAMPHFLNLRYYGAIYGPFYLLAGLGFWYLVSTVSNWIESSDRKLISCLAVMILILGAGSDYWRFRRMFVRNATADLSIKMLLDARNR
jgi:4-amino-4-deoxy-L-arabinose transferase-like glycosyltransferase